MDNTLNTLGILQTNASRQPYNTPPFYYAGTENVEAGFFAAHIDIVDWVLLELRNANLSATVVARRAAFVKQDDIYVKPSVTFSQKDEAMTFSLDLIQLPSLSSNTSTLILR